MTSLSIPLLSAATYSFVTNIREYGYSNSFEWSGIQMRNLISNPFGEVDEEARTPVQIMHKLANLVSRTALAIFALAVCLVSAIPHAYASSPSVRVVHVIVREAGDPAPSLDEYLRQRFPESLVVRETQDQLLHRFTSQPISLG
jgi:hypothetical protein